MPRSNPLAFSPQTREVAKLLGESIRVARVERRWTQQELAERVGISRITMAKVEKGDLNVRLGVALEAAVVLGVPLFSSDDERRRLELERIGGRLALLPSSARRPVSVDDDF